MTDAILFNEVTKVYRTPSPRPWGRPRAVEALHGVSFSCPANSITCLLGPNGAGKTTIIKILAGLILPDAGEARVLGVSLSKASPRFFSRMGLVTPNERSFYWRLTGRQNLEFFASLYGLRGRARRERVMEVLAVVELEDQEDKPYRLYSTGMKQKMLLARALLGRPEVLLLDEPTIHLDPLAQDGMHALIERLQAHEKTTVLLSTHNLAEAEKLSDFIILIHRGTIRAQGSVSDVRSRVAQTCRFEMEFTRLPAAGWEQGLDVTVHERDGNRLTCETVDESRIPGIVEAAARGGGRLLGLRRSRELLAGIFSDMVDEKRC